MSDTDQKRRIRHVINTVGPNAPDRLLIPQRLTLDSIERARSITDPKISVDVVSVSFPDELTPRPWLTRGPDLQRSVLDLGDFPDAPALPLLADLLAAFGSDDDWDIGIFTNLDIAVQPLFYELVAEIADEGYDAFTINRRTVDPMSSDAGLARIGAQSGGPHPGHDCFVFTPAVLAQIDVGEIVVGARFIGRALRTNLILAAERCHTFTELHATFHLGDDRSWAGPKAQPLTAHNRDAFHDVLDRLSSRCGADRVLEVDGVGWFLSNFGRAPTTAPSASQPPMSPTAHNYDS